MKGCIGSEAAEGLPESLMLGYRVVKIVTKYGGDTKTIWVAPALDCYALESEFTTHDGRRRTELVTALREGQPTDDLFEVPAGYVVRTPAEIQAQYSQRIPGAAYLSERDVERLMNRYKYRSGQRQ
jgi:hypothetical protein